MGKRVNNGKRTPSKIKTGRPTHKESAETQKKLRILFDDGIGGVKAARISQVNEMTVLKYFRGWADELVSLNSESFFDREIRAREITLNALDTRLSNLGTMLSIVNARINHSTQIKIPVSNDDLTLAKEYNKEMREIILQKGAIEMRPSSKYVLEREVDNFIGQKLATSNS